MLTPESLPLESLEIENAEPIQGKANRLRATFDLRIHGVGTIRRCRLLRSADGKPFVYGPAVRDEYLGWVTTVEFAPEMRDLILQRILVDPRVRDLL